MMNYLVFSVDNQEFGVSIDRVQRVIWAVFATPVNEASSQLLGMISVQNEIIPVLNIRNILGLCGKELDLTDQFIICEFSTSKAVLWVDHVLEIISLDPQERYQCDSSLIHDAKVQTVLKKNDQLITVYDWEQLVSQTMNDEEKV